MKVLITPDIHGWAISNLTDGIIKHNPHIKFINVAVHPRAVSATLAEVMEAVKDEDIDLWHGMYWHSANQLLEMYPHLSDVPKVLTHHNHYALGKSENNWKDYDTLTTETKWATEKLKEMHDTVYHIPLSIDLDRYTWIDELPEEKTIGYVGRVIEHKNLKKICEVAGKNGYKVVGSGYIDKPKYWATVPKENLEFNGGIGRDMKNKAFKKDEVYRKMTCFCMYSTGEKETGTLPLFEAMARGVPVLTTWQGSARDLIEDGVNGIVFDEDNFEEKLNLIMGSKGLRDKLRKNAWQTVKNYPEQKTARMFEKVYYKTLFKDKRIVSVIVPTCDRPLNLVKVLASIEKDPYPAKEIVVIDDGEMKETKQVITECRKSFKTCIKYLKTDTEGYNLAMARNMGAVEAIGDILLFLDDRLALTPILGRIVEDTQPTTWSFGNKRSKGKLGNKARFVENFSWIYRKDFIEGGMFCERMNVYGGMSQEIRQRYSKQGISFRFCPEIIADELNKSGSSKRRSEIWKAKLLLNKMYG